MKLVMELLLVKKYHEYFFLYTRNLLCKMLFTNITIHDMLITTMKTGNAMKILKGYVFRMYPNKK